MQALDLEESVAASVQERREREMTGVSSNVTGRPSSRVANQGAGDRSGVGNTVVYRPTVSSAGKSSEPQNHRLEPRGEKRERAVKVGHSIQQYPSKVYFTLE